MPDGLLLANSHAASAHGHQLITISLPIYRSLKQRSFAKVWTIFISQTISESAWTGKTLPLMTCYRVDLAE